METMRNFQVCCYLVMICFVIFVNGKKFDETHKPDWAKKDIRDYSDADLERLFDQWEEDEEPLENDELPEHLRPQPKLDFSNVDMSNPEAILQLSKKGKTLMMFVTVSGNPTKQKLEEVTTLWQSSLHNNHIQVERFVVDDRRAIFMLKDGSQAWSAKDYLIEQPDCEEVVIENKSYYGKQGNRASAGKSTTESKGKRSSEDL